jgi:hypothetical protein
MAGQTISILGLPIHSERAVLHEESKNKKKMRIRNIGKTTYSNIDEFNGFRVASYSYLFELNA